MISPLDALAAIGLAAGAGAAGATTIAIRRSATRVRELQLDPTERSSRISSEIQEAGSERGSKAGEQRSEEEGEASAEEPGG